MPRPYLIRKRATCSASNPGFFLWIEALSSANWRAAILLQLLERFRQGLVLSRRLVLDGEMILVPHVGEAIPHDFSGLFFLRALLVGEGLAGFVHVRGFGMSYQRAEIVEVCDVGGRFFEVDVSPGIDELLRSKRRLHA